MFNEGTRGVSTLLEIKYFVRAFWLSIEISKLLKIIAFASVFLKRHAKKEG